MHDAKFKIKAGGEKYSMKRRCAILFRFNRKISKMTVQPCVRLELYYEREKWIFSPTARYIRDIAMQRSVLFGVAKRFDRSLNW